MSMNTFQAYRDAVTFAVTDMGKVDFEQLDRINDGLVSVPSAQYDHVVVSPVPPQGFTTSSYIATILLSLKPNGTLSLSEPVLVQETAVVPGSSIKRTSTSLVSELKLAGFIDIDIQTRPANADEVRQWIDANNESDVGNILPSLALASASKFTIITNHSFYIFFCILLIDTYSLLDNCKEVGIQCRRSSSHFLW